MPGESFLQTDQKYVTLVHRLDELGKVQNDYNAKFTAKVERMETDVSSLRERVARLEAQRDADRAQVQAELARFLAEIERAETRVARLLARPDDPSAAA